MAGQGSYNEGPVAGKPGLTHPADFTSVNANVPAVSTEYDLVQPTGKVIITNNSTVGLSINMAAAATTANFTIPPGGTFTYDGRPISKFFAIGPSATGTFSYFAH